MYCMIDTLYSKYFCLNTFHGNFHIHSTTWSPHSCLSTRAFSRPILYHYAVTNKKHLSNIYAPFHLLTVSLILLRGLWSLSVQPVHSLVFTNTCTTGIRRNTSIMAKNTGHRTENTYAELHTWVLWKSCRILLCC